LLAGCGDDDSSVSITGTSEPPETTSARPTSTTSAAQGAVSLAVGSTTLGSVVTDGAGRTLYVFENDPPGISNCTGACLTTWPRYVPEPGAKPQGVEPRLAGTINTDGGQQATLAGRPLYYYVGDRAPGDTNGQGIGGRWFAIRADGEQVS
jgi:predicted lipoprotein with Yx(FWY)xxD motif